MIISFILWYFLIILVGWASLPLLYRFTPLLADRGYNLAKPAGLLVWGYIFWLLTSLGVLQNDLGGIFFSFVGLTGVSIGLAGVAGVRNVLRWIKDKWRLVFGSELLFLFCFLAWAFVRSINPDIVGTEKPMELAFINSILRSLTFPPLDPWLSGYSISYYYFGYVLVAMLAKATGTSGGVAFNLGISAWFALTACGAYGVLYSLLASLKQSHASRFSKVKPALQGLLAPLYILLVSNVVGFLEMLHSLGLFWSKGVDGVYRSRFWQWLNILELNQPPSPPFSWFPERLSGTWWWRASRVLQDFDIMQQPREIIDEFPYFSYFLADLHPHVLAMPFVLLAVGLSFHLYLWGTSKSLSVFRIRYWIRKPGYWFFSLVLGGLAFLNTWDFPIYVALFCSVYLLVHTRQNGKWSWGIVKDTIYLGLTTGILGFILYLPFYVGFSSQAGGVLPSLNFFTRGAYFWVMFGTLLLPILGYLTLRIYHRLTPGQWFEGVKVAAIPMVGLLIVSYVLALFLINLTVLGNLLVNLFPTSETIQRTGMNLIGLGSLFLSVHGNPDPAYLIFGSLVNRLYSPGTWISLLIIISCTWVLITRLISRKENKSVEEQGSSSPEGFVFLLIILGCGLVLFPEFLYLRDQFGWRMNTIFKFYFQVWILWGIAAAFGTAVLLGVFGGWKNILVRVLFTILMVIGLAYPFFTLSSQMRSIQLDQLSLDGTDFFRFNSPDEMMAIDWLKSAPLGVVAEAIGGSYSGYARVSTFSGMPTVLGWPGHQSQWRGGAYEIGSREQDIERLFRTSDWMEAQAVIRKYNIQYIYLGSLERGKYRVNELKFRNNLITVYQNQSVIIYAVPD